MSRRGRRWRSAFFVTVVVGLFCAGWRALDALHYRKTMARIEDDIENGLVSRATKQLVAVLGRYPDSDQAAFLLGTCEKARGRNQAAAEAWAKVPPGSRFALEVTEGLVDLKLEQGLLTEAEQLVIRKRNDSRFAASDPSILLGAIYSRAGRLKEAKSVIEGLWRRHNAAGEAASATAINELWLYIQLQEFAVPDEAIRAILEQAGQAAPDDDRIWLWKANLAIRTRSYNDAARWLDRCLRRRPEDTGAWHARLDWAVATKHVTAARDAIEHLPAAESSPAEVARLAAWFAAQRGNDDAEQTHLRRLIAADPTDFAALDRLIDLSVKKSQPGEVAALRQRRAEIARLQARYAKLIARHQPRRDARELARLADRLGRRFEARAFVTIALATACDPTGIQRELAHLGQSSRTLPASAHTLDDLLAPHLDGSLEKPSSPTRPVAQPR